MKFYCKCGQKLSAPEEAVGRKGHCPRCEKVFQVPSRAEAEAQVRARPRKQTSRAERARRNPGAMVKWYCECGQKLGVPESDAGQKGRCPRCHKSFRVPDPEAMRQKAEQRAASAQPSSVAPPIPTPPPVPVPPPPPAPGAPEPEVLVEADAGAETESMSTPAVPTPPPVPEPAAAAPARSVLRPPPAPAASEPEALVEADPGAETEALSAPAVPTPPPVPKAPVQAEPPRAARPAAAPPPPVPQPAAAPESPSGAAVAGNVLAEGWFIEALDLDPKRLTELFLKLSGDCAPVRLVEADGALTFSCRPLKGHERVRVLLSMLWWLAYCGIGTALGWVGALIWGPACLIGFDFIGFFSWPLVILNTIIATFQAFGAGFYLLKELAKLVFATLSAREYYYFPRRYLDVVPDIVSVPRGDVSQLHLVNAKKARKSSKGFVRPPSAKGCFTLVVLFLVLAGVGVIGMTAEEMGEGFKGMQIVQFIIGGVLLLLAVLAFGKLIEMARRKPWVLAFVVGAPIPLEPKSKGFLGGLRSLFGGGKKDDEDEERIVCLFLPDKAYASDIEALQKRVSAACSPGQTLVQQ